MALGGFVASDIAGSRIPRLLLQKSEIILLREIKDFKNILFKLDGEGFPCLEVLSILYSDVEYLIDATSYQTPRVAFPILELLELKEFPNLKEIWWCDMIKNIVLRDGEEGVEDIILFPNLTSFSLNSLPNLMSFCIEPYSFEWSSIEEILMNGCPKFKTYGKLQKINYELDSKPQDQEPCLECVPRGRNNSPMVGSDQGTTKKFQESSSVNKEVRIPQITIPATFSFNNKKTTQ